MEKQGSGGRNAHDGIRGRSGLQQDIGNTGNGEPSFSRGIRQNVRTEGGE